ncbi:porin [Candidatus Pelagibacter ubique]|nr:porin [Candidatus Pelagibacter ubique]
MNIKKIGMTALAASLVSTSVFAGDLAVTGSASITVENYSGEQVNTGKAFSMGNEINFNGSGELDNGMSVAVHYQLDEGANSGNTTNPLFDNHSVTVSSDALGTLVFAGHGGSTALSQFDTTAAGDIHDNFDGQIGTAQTATATGDAVVQSTAGGNNILLYTLPSIVDGLGVSASYTPQGSNDEASTAFGLTYSGVEGLTVSYAAGDNNAAAGTTNNADVTTMKASYAYGPITVAYSDHEFDSATTANDQDTTSYSVSYTVSDSISVTYGTEEIAMPGVTNDVDAEFSKLSVAYTAGGMTISASQQEAENIAYGTASTQDQDYWSLGLSFAF